MTTGSDSAMGEELRAKLAEARAELDAARTELDIMLGELIGDLHLNLGRYVMDNIRREIRKRPQCLERLGQEQLAEMKSEVEQLVRAESVRIIDSIRNAPEWYDEDTVFLNEASSLWKTIQSIDPAVNKLVKKYGIAPVSLRNWNWLGDSLALLAEERYPPAKRAFIEKTKLYEYTQSRFAEETRLQSALKKLEEF